MSRKFASSELLLEFIDDDGTRYVMNAVGAEDKFGSIGHFVNSVPVGTSEDLEPCRLEWDKKLEAFMVKANYSWDSNQEYIEIRVSYCKSDEDLNYWHNIATFEHLPDEPKRIVLANMNIPIEPMITRQEYSKKEK